MYSQQISSPVLEIINGIPVSWDPCTASAEATNNFGTRHTAWSPCGRFIAATFGDQVQVHDSSTLERLSVFKSPPRERPALIEFLTFSPDGRLLACAHMTQGYTLVVSLVSVSVLTPVSRYWDYNLFVWDVQTGVAVTDDQFRGSVPHMLVVSEELVFSGNCRTATLLTGCGSFYVCDVTNGTYMCKGKLAASSSFLLGGHWAHEDTFRVATSFKTSGKLIINIQELRPTINPPLLVVESFSMPPRDGGISFSPVSFHASFVSQREVVILDVRDSRVLLQVEAPHPPYTPPGHFSPDGCFFACGIKQVEISVWKNASAGYVPWSNLRPRSSFRTFSFSPTTSSILARGPTGVQLLEYGNHLTIPSPNKFERQQQRENHLVAYSADGTRIAMARRENSVVTVLGTLPNILRRSFDTDMRILDIKIVGNVIFVADGYKLASWDLETGEPIHDDETSAIAASMPHSHFMLSDNCSQIAFTQGNTISRSGDRIISLYDVQARRIICNHATQHRFATIRFSPDGRQLWLAAVSLFFPRVSLAKLERVNDEDFADVTGRVVTTPRARSGPSWANLFSPLFSSHRSRPGWVLEQADSECTLEWVADSRGNKLLWLPLGWRAEGWRNVRWDGDFLACVGGDHPEPIIIKFQSQPVSFLTFHDYE